jgi:beta-glucanase (GH16 family)
MRKLVLFTVAGLAIFQSCKTPGYTVSEQYMYVRKHGRGDKKWQLVWEDNFSGSTLDTAKWTKTPAGASDWDKHMTQDERCFALDNGMLYLKGIRNPDTTLDKRPFLTGGIYSKGKFAFQYGKIEIRARLGHARGAWPAMWMLAATNKNGTYPRNGEIDIMEHLNFDSTVYQTIHSYYTLVLKQDKTPPHYSTAKIRVDDFNVFGLQWYPGRIVYTVNGEETFTYPRVKEADPSQWPFDQPFYILIDQQLGGNWVGHVQADNLPVEMAVDWVRVYQ